MAPIRRFFKPPQDHSYFLFGPRGTGKTTLMKALYPHALLVDLLKPEVLRQHLGHPEALYTLVSGNPTTKVIVIDEVQKAPDLLSVVHDLIETHPHLQFVLTGSSSRKLKRVGTNLLAGRALNLKLHPFMASELGRSGVFSLDTVLAEGMLPVAVSKSPSREILKSYIDLYMNEEIRMEGLIRRVEDFSRFLEVISFSHGATLNVSNIARECEVKRKTVENYVQILEDLLLAFQLPVFTHRPKRQLSAHPKFYLFDAGVYQLLRPKHFGKEDSTHTGPALEGLVAQHLRAWNDYSGGDHKLYFWRTRSGVEVDFVVYGPTQFVAIEVKNARRVDPQDTKGLETFLADYPEATAVLLYRGKEQRRLGRVWCVPCEAWLKALMPNQPLFVGDTR